MFPWPAFISFALVTTFTPGANTILSMRNAARYGFRRSYLFNLGILTGCACVMTLCTVFSAVFFALIPKIQPVMRVLGAAYILYLAWHTLFPGRGASDGEKKGSLYVQGTLLPFINPKYYLYCITAISTYVLPHTSRPLEIAGFALMLLLTGFFATLCWAFFGSAIQRLMQNQRTATIINVVMALLLVYCAVSLFL
ncbi:LysE family transporter [Ruminococcaceae bacterium OttesenSCG-928-D13]|nr:LysE family transporter [Ruminococcaceae bacterium OttesenSCG-928-D13]